MCTDESLTDEERSAARREYKDNYGLEPPKRSKADERGAPTKADDATDTDEPATAPKVEQKTAAKVAAPTKSTSGR